MRPMFLLALASVVSGCLLPIETFECEENDDCTAAEFCADDGACFNRGEIGSHCREDSWCKPGLVCDTSVTAGRCEEP